MSDLERELEQELHRVLDPVAAVSIPARRKVQPARGLSRMVFGGAGAALGVKLLTGVAVAAAAVTVAGVTTTGSLNPVNWGQQVQERVESCKAELQTGQHGIGDCVSDFASGRRQADTNNPGHEGNRGGSTGAGATKTNDSSNGSGADAGGQSQDDGKDKAKDRPTHPSVSTKAGP